MSVGYNENNRFAVQWLRNLITSGHLPDGFIDDRSIADLRPEHVESFAQYHFFAGIGGWPLALEIAGWPATRPVWTGSCPCQPFSVAGKRKGAADDRHLWPEFCRLIAECRPATIFGEQVASKDGREWLAGVRADLEALGYVVGAADLCAAGLGAPHIRQRLFWVGAGFGGSSFACRLGDANDTRPQGWGEHLGEHADKRAPWAASYWLDCLDRKARRVPAEPAFQPLADGFPGSRVGTLRGSGNAILPQVAAEFVRAFMEIEGHDG